MRIIGVVEVTLPFALEYCAEGPDVDPIRAQVNGIDVSIALPPSMGDKTDGRCFFASGWAWWTGSLLSIEMTRAVAEADSDFDAIRLEFERAADEALRRLLNSYRVRFHKPSIHPVRIDPKALTLEVEATDGSRSAFPESPSMLFYNALPKEAPLDSSINAKTLILIASDMGDNSATSVADHLALDAEWLESLGETDRAARIRSLAHLPASPPSPG